MAKHGDERTGNLVCSFCGKSQDEVRKLIAGPTVYICDECIDLCNDIILEEGAEPIRGIYTVRVRDGAKKNSKAWGGAGYFGNRPTFETNRTFLEVHLFDMDEDLYGRTLLVEFIDLIRPDQKFNSVEDLVQQIKQDCIQAKARLQSLSRDNPCTAYPLGRAQEDGTI